MGQGLLFQGTQRHQVCRRSEPVTAQYFVLVSYLDMGQVMVQGALTSSEGTFDKSSLYVSRRDNGN